MLKTSICESSSAAYSKPLPVESTSKDGTYTHNTGKEGVVHKIEARDVDGDYTDPEYLLTLAEYTNQHDTDSLTDVDAEDYADESLDNDDVSNSGDIIDLDGARADFSEESSGDEHEDDDYHDSFGDDDVVDPDTEHEVPEETSDYDDYDDTFWGNDIVDDDEFRDTLSKEALDDDDDATLEVDDDDDDIDLPNEAPDSYDDAKVVSPDGDGDAETFGIVDVHDDVGDDVDDDYETNNESPDEDLNDDDDTHADEVKGPMQVLEEPPSLKHIHKIDHKSKVSRPRNPLNKNNDSKLGRLLKKHHNKDATRKNSVKKYLDDDINDDDGFGDFKLSHKRKEKIPRHEGRRALSASKNVDFSHVQKREVFGSQEGNGGDSVDRNVDDYDRQFLASRGDFFFENKQPSASDIEKQNVGSTSDTSVDKENDQHVEEDEIEGEEEEEKQMNDMNSSYSNDDNDVSEPGLTSDSVFEEDKIEGEDEEEDNEIKEVDNSSHKDDINFDESEVGNPRDDLLTDDDEQNDVASGVDAH